VNKSGRLYTDVRVETSGLVPNGVYSVFCGTIAPDSEQPLCQNVERTLPLASRDRHRSPDPSSFVADADRKADFRGRVEGRLLEVTQVLHRVVYHFDGLTYHPLPNRRPAPAHVMAEAIGSGRVG
jgi:hypothetical protein